MRSALVRVGWVLLIVFGGVLQAHAQFSIRAASDQAVAGWNRVDYNGKTVWVSPTVSLASGDVLRAEPTRGPDGRMAVGLVFTDEGARKMQDLSVAQLNKLIAFVLDDSVVFAPLVRAQIGKEAQITGNSPSGLTQSVVDRIVASVNRK
jgi:preprotein translocase subunit SecD